MFYISKVTPLLFVLAFINLFVSIYFKASSQDYIHSGLIAVFGFLGTVLISAMYQIIPNSQQQKLKYEPISFVVSAILVIESILLWMNYIFPASVLFFVAVVLFLSNLLPIIKVVKPITIRYLAAALFYFFLSSIFLVLSNFQIVPVQLAIHTFTIGVLINAVFGVQTAWFPMFFMQNLDFKILNRIFYVVQILAVIVLSSFYFLNYHFLAFAGILELIAVLSFVGYMFSVIKKGMKLAKIPYAVKFFSIGHIFLILGLITAVVVSGFQLFQYINIHFDFMIYGFGLFTVIGGVLHLTPRIIWNMVSVEKARQGKQVPQINKVLDENVINKMVYILVSIFVLSVVGDFILKSGEIWLLFGLIVLTYFVKFSIDFYRFYKY